MRFFFHLFLISTSVSCWLWRLQLAARSGFFFRQKRNKKEIWHQKPKKRRLGRKQCPFLFFFCADVNITLRVILAVSGSFYVLESTVPIFVFWSVCQPVAVRNPFIALSFFLLFLLPSFSLGFPTLFKCSRAQQCARLVSQSSPVLSSAFNLLQARPSSSDKKQ